MVMHYHLGRQTEDDPKIVAQSSGTSRRRRRRIVTGCAGLIRSDVIGPGGHQTVAVNDDCRDGVLKKGQRWCDVEDVTKH